LQLWLRPYREPESNQLKVLVETQIFLTFLLSFILRVLPSDGRSSLEPLGATFYGWVLVASLLALCTAALLLTAAQVSCVVPAAPTVYRVFSTVLPTRKYALSRKYALAVCRFDVERSFVTSWRYGHLCAQR
jgi:hypothetical protein